MRIQSIFLLAAVAATAGAGNGVDLAAPMLKVHADLPLYNAPGIALAAALADGRAAAPSRGLLWKGMNFIRYEELSGSPSGDPFPALYKKQACLADAVIIGHTAVWASHLSTSGTAVYSDYDFTVDTVLKNNSLNPTQADSHIVVTRIGGALSLPDGPLTFESHLFPALRAGATYLLFLKYIPNGSGYQSIDFPSTLVSTGTRWVIAPKPFFEFVIPELQVGALESSIRTWAAYCS